MSAQLNKKDPKYFVSEGEAGAGSINDSNEKANFDGDAGRTYETAIKKNGVKLHPQPTSDPLDPLNWTSFRKHSVLGIVMYL